MPRSWAAAQSSNAVALAPRGSETGRCLSVADYVRGAGGHPGDDRRRGVPMLTSLYSIVVEIAPRFRLDLLPGAHVTAAAGLTLRPHPTMPTRLHPAPGSRCTSVGSLDNPPAGGVVLGRGVDRSIARSHPAGRSTS